MPGVFLVSGGVSIAAKSIMGAICRQLCCDSAVPHIVIFAVICVLGLVVSCVLMI